MGSTLYKHIFALPAGQLAALDLRDGLGTKTTTFGGHFLFQYWSCLVCVLLLLSWLLFGRFFLGRLLLNWLLSGCVFLGRLRFGCLCHNFLLLVPAHRAVLKLDFVRPATVVIPM